jgi:hypothetical protein
LDEAASRSAAALETSWMLDFIEAGEIAVKIKDCIFMHGGITNGRLNKVPEDTNDHTGVDDWFSALRTWKEKKLTEFIVYYGVPENAAEIKEPYVSQTFSC